MSSGAFGGVDVHTIVLPFLCNSAQLGYTIKLSIEVQYVLAIEALAGLYEVQVRLLELSEFHDVVLGALELPAVSIAWPCGTWRMTCNLVFLSEDGVDLEMRGP